MAIGHNGWGIYPPPPCPNTGHVQAPPPVLTPLFDPDPPVLTPTLVVFGQGGGGEGAHKTDFRRQWGTGREFGRHI